MADIDNVPGWLGRLNYYVLQWFFIRLAFVYEDDGSYVGWVILRGVIPLSRWEARK